MGQTFDVIFSYVVHGPRDTHASPEGHATVEGHLDELSFQIAVLDDFLTGQEARENGWTRDNTVITQFTYTALERTSSGDTGQV